MSVLTLCVCLGAAPALAQDVKQHGRMERVGGNLASVADGGVQPASSDLIGDGQATPSDAPGSVAGALCTQSYYHCQGTDVTDALVSQRERFLVADDFIPKFNTNIDSLCWWGAYGAPSGAGGYDDCQGLYPDTFEVTYFENAGGVPGAVIASFSQEAGTLTVVGPVATGNTIAGMLPEYEFTATHAVVPVTADGCYWIMISNLPATECLWYWEYGFRGNDYAMQDGDGVNPPDGFSLGESLAADLAFCINNDLRFGWSQCLPDRPANDNCADAEPIAGTGVFPYDNQTATADGGSVASCYPSTNIEPGSDVWYCWTSPCTDAVVVSSCGTTTSDSMIAVYEGCATCPLNGAPLLACNDDRCGDNLRQSMAVFDAIAGQSYLIRIGTYPGEPRAAGAFTISCGPPDNAACAPGTGDCCNTTGTGSPACEDELCCELVCACDPFCCDVEWDEDCAASGFGGSGCGAALLCKESCDPCGRPESGDCCTNNGTRGCSHAACCDLVCACDPFCCNVAWDEGCATVGADGSGCGAQALCTGLCEGQPLGACCGPAFCAEMTEAECVSGVWLGDLTTCGPDCDGDGTTDACAIALGSSNDCNTDGLPDECMTYATAQQAPDPFIANRTITFGTATTHELMAIQVLFADLPAPFDTGIGHSMWVGEPYLRSENGAAKEPIPGFDNIWVAMLQCEPVYLDWSAYDDLRIFGVWVVPSSTYEIRALPAGCASDDLGNYTMPHVTQTAQWGDLVGLFDLEAQFWAWPDGSVDVATDVVANLDKFSSQPTSPTKARTDLEPSVLDWCMCITDITVILDAFSGRHGYPFSPYDSVPCP